MSWRSLAHISLDPLPPRWREDLASRLGQRPRRLGAWAELALHGARLCLDACGEAHLPAGTALRVASLSGPRAATQAIIEQARSGPPMPFSFMQSQPSQMLAALSQHLGWHGDARFTLARDREALLQLAQLESANNQLLIGWVEEDLATHWWRLTRTPAAERQMLEPSGASVGSCTR